MARVRNRYTGEIVLSGLSPQDAIVEHAMIEDGIVLNTERWQKYYKALIIRQGSVYRLGNWESVNE
jgi:hypothetical protein